MNANIIKKNFVLLFLCVCAFVNGCASVDYNNKPEFIDLLGNRYKVKTNLMMVCFEEMPYKSDKKIICRIGSMIYGSKGGEFILNDVIKQGTVFEIKNILNPYIVSVELDPCEYYFKSDGLFITPLKLITNPHYFELLDSDEANSSTNVNIYNISAI